MLNLAFAASESGAFAAQKNRPISDDLIVDQVRIKLSADAIVKGGAMQVDCKQKVVTLSGVETAKQETRAGQITKKVKGVKQVVNNLTVKSH